MTAAAAVVAVVAAVAAAGLALSATGSMLVAALLLGASTRRWWGLAVPVSVVAVAIRHSTMDFAELAGIQSVVGPAVWTGSGLAAASTGLAAIAVVGAVVAGSRDHHRADDVVAAVAAGAFAAALVAGPGPGGRLWLRVVATVIAAGVTLALRRFGRPLGAAIGVSSLVAATGAVALALLSGRDLPDGLERLGPAHALRTADHGEAALVALAFGLLATVLLAVMLLPTVSTGGPDRLIRRRGPAIDPSSAPTSRADGHAIQEAIQEIEPERHTLPSEPRSSEPFASESGVAAPARAVPVHPGRDRPVRRRRLRGRPGRPP